MTESARESSKQAFEARRQELMQAHRGKYALFVNGAFINTFDSLDVAYDVAVRGFGLDGFFIGRLLEGPPPASLPALMLGLIRARG